MRVAWGVLLPSVIIVAALFMLAIWMAVRAQGRRTVTGQEGLVGEIGEARSDLTPEGTVFVHGEIWRAVSTAPVSRGQSVRVVKVENLRLLVEPAIDEALRG